MSGNSRRMVGFRNEETSFNWAAGYEGFTSAPSTPTKYTVNKAKRVNTTPPKRYVVSMTCIILTSTCMLAMFVGLLLLGYYMTSCNCKVKMDVGCQKSVDGSDESTTQNNNFFPASNDLSNDQLRIDVDGEYDGGGNYSKSTIYPENNYGATGKNKNGEIPEEKEILETDDFYNGNNNTVADNGKDPDTIHDTGLNKNLMLIEASKKTRPKLRLPRSIIPTNYKISIVPHIDDNLLTTDGHVNITILCRNNTEKIILNKKDINVQLNTLEVFNSNRTIINVNDTEEDEYNEMFMIRLEEEMQSGKTYYIVMSYNGKIRTVPNGLYRSYFINLKTNEKTSMVNTLFSPAFARYVYPCFDEPNFKAKFSFSIGRKIKMFTLSNMKILYSEPVKDYPDYVWDHYEESPQMSTYLTAFVVAPINSLRKYNMGSREPTEINLWVRPDNFYQTALALDISKRVLKFFEDYFGIDFPLKKIDIVAVPALSYEAMENWGIIIFKEGTILIDRGNSIKSQQTLAFTLAHELAHQWFGNLVTPKWWDDLWLKEGFSSYFQYLAISSIYPNWEVPNEFAFNEMDVAFISDALSFSRPIINPVDDLNEDMFNVISYNKGSSLIRMIASVIGPENMKKGLNIFLKTYAYGNTDNKELWSILETLNDGDVDLNTIMEVWTTQPGFPVITISRDYANNKADVYQERFLLKSTNDVSPMWWIPVSYTTKSDKQFDDVKPKFWIEQKEKTLIDDMPKNDSWIYANLKSTGYYLANYDVNNWLMLIYDFPSMTPEIKGQIVRDSFYLARGGHLAYQYALSIGGELSKETNYIPWKSASQVLAYLRDSLIKMPVYGNFRSYVLSLLRKVYNSLVVEVNENNMVPWLIPDDAILQLHAENIINMACTFHETHCVINAKLLFTKWMNAPDDGNDIPVAIRPLIYCTAIREGGRREWDFAFDRYVQATLEGGNYNAEKMNLVISLGCATEQWLLTRALGLVISDSGLSKQEGIMLFRSVAANNNGQWIATSFIHSEWKRLLDIYQTPIIINKMVQSLVKYVNSPYEIDQLKSLVKNITKYTGQESEILVESIEMAESNQYWIEKNYGEVSMWLDAFVHEFKLKY